MPSATMPSATMTDSRLNELEWPVLEPAWLVSNPPPGRPDWVFGYSRCQLDTFEDRMSIGDLYDQVRVISLEMMWHDDAT